MQIVCIYPGRFQPFALHHYKVYKYLCSVFGKDNVYISTSDKTQFGTSPFNFKQKKYIIKTLYDIPENKIIYAKVPYQARSYTNLWQPNKTVLFYALSKKDRDRLKNSKYIKDTIPKKLNTYDKEAYVFQVPYIKLNINQGQQLNGTNIRKLFSDKDISIDTKKQLFKDIFGQYNEKVFNFIFNKLNKKNINQSRQLLLCGGNAGHCNHPYEYNDMTFKQVKQLIIALCNGDNTKLKNITIKYDGQNLYASYIDDKVVISRNKSQLENGGMNRQELNILNQKVKQVFLYAIKDLNTAFNKIPYTILNSYFQNGKNWLSLEVIHPLTKNVIPYKIPMLILHNFTDSTKNVMDFYNVLQKYNATNQEHYLIKKPQIIKLHKVNIDIQQYTNTIDNLLKKYNLQENNTIGEYKIKYFEQLIKRKFKVQDKILKKLSQRWALGSNYYILNQFKKECNNKQFKQWVYKFEKQQYKDSYNKCIYPLQILFMKLGVKILKNIDNNKHKINIIKQQLINSIYKIMETNDKNMVKIVIQELTKLQKLDYQILSFEGIVFKFNDRICKLTGSFPIINKIEGLLKYEKKQK